MVIPGFSLSTYLAIPLVLSLLAQGERIKVSLVKNVRQVSINKERSLSSRELISTNLTPKIYYVSGSGNDKNSGISTSSAFRTIQKAADLTNPGDTVLIMNGVYTNLAKAPSVVSIKRSGTANAWIRYKAYPGHLPKIKHNTWNGILISSGASYIEINGLEVIGNNANITLDYALSQKTNRSNPLTSGNCINIDGRANGHVHHIRILNNKVHDCGGAGIGALQADYVKVDNNTVFNNAWYGVYGCSGISMGSNWNSDTNRGYKMFVTNNKVYNNRMYIPWIAVGKITDGNGIIIDTSRNDQNSNLDAYRGRTLIQNNLTFNNGGSGIHTFLSDHVDIVNNTAVLNNQSPEIKSGQIFARGSSDVRISRNILYAFPGKDITNHDNQNKNVIYDYNIYINSSKVNVNGPHDIVANSEFLSKHSTLEKISGDWKSRLDKQNPPTQTYVEPKSAGFVCGQVTYRLQDKLIKVGCSPLSLAQTTFSDFSDVSSNYWAAQFIQKLSQLGVIAGFPDGSFRPEEAVTRAQFAAMVNQAFQKTQQRQVINFTDVPSNYWASSAIGQAYAIGFLSGYPGNRFEPNQAIPRQQVLVSLANGLEYTPSGNTESTLQYFNDASNIASYARSPIAAATQKQIVVNYPNVKFLNPTATATRAQVAAFIYQALVSSNQASAINSRYVVSNLSN